jgi:hypothetical protein
MSPEDTHSELVLDLIDQHGGSYVLSEERHAELLAKYGMDVLLLVVHDGGQIVLRAVALEEGPEAAGEAMLAMGVAPDLVAIQVARFRAAVAAEHVVRGAIELAAQRKRDRRN